MPRRPQRVFTVGVEEEYQIIDPVTRDLSSSATPLLQEAQKVLGEAVQYEMQLSQIEVVTPICHVLTEVREQVTRLRSGVIGAARGIGREIAAAGTHPFARWQEQQLSPGERYSSIQEHYQQLAREQSIFACHVHVGIDDRSDAIDTMNHMRGWLALLLALMGNSPFAHGVDTGYASYRTEIWSRWPFAGPPQTFATIQEYEAVIAALNIPGTIDNAREVYWDVRLSPRFNTIETRIADVCLSVDEAVVLVGLVRALVSACYTCAVREVPYVPFRQELLRATHWQAARYGLDAYLLDPQTEQIAPAHQLLQTLLQFVRPALEDQGDWDVVSGGVEAIIQEGTGAARQRAVYARTGCLQDVVDFVVEETARGVL